MSESVSSVRSSYSGQSSASMSSIQSVSISFMRCNPLGVVDHNRHSFVDTFHSIHLWKTHRALVDLSLKTVAFLGWIWVVVSCADRCVCRSFPLVSRSKVSLVNYSVNVRSIAIIVKSCVGVCVVVVGMLTKKCRCATVLGNNNSVDIILGSIFIYLF